MLPMGNCERCNVSLTCLCYDRAHGRDLARLLLCSHHFACSPLQQPLGSSELIVISELCSDADHSAPEILINLPTIADSTHLFLLTIVYLTTLIFHRHDDISGYTITSIEKRGGHWCRRAKWSCSSQAATRSRRPSFEHSRLRSPSSSWRGVELCVRPRSDACHLEEEWTTLGSGTERDHTSRS